MTESRPFIVGIGGTPNPLSSTAKAIATCLRAAQLEGASTLMITGKELLVPMYDPTSAERTEEARRLVDAFRRADGIVIGSPAYHGSISGLVKNALDYTEDLRADTRCYFDGLAIGCVACAGGWQAAGQTLSALRSIAHALRGWPTPLGVMLNTTNKIFDDAGDCTDLSVKFQLETVGRQVVQFAKARKTNGVSDDGPAAMSRVLAVQLD